MDLRGVANHERGRQTHVLSWACLVFDSIEQDFDRTITHIEGRLDDGRDAWFEEFLRSQLVEGGEGEVFWSAKPYLVQAAQCCKPRDAVGGEERGGPPGGTNHAILADPRYFILFEASGPDE